MKKILIFAIILLFALVAAACSAEAVPLLPEEQPQTEQTVPPETEQPASSFPDIPAFATLDIYGNAVDESLFADYELTMLNIWGTYCSPCLAEMPDLAAMSAELPEGLQIVGLVCDAVNEGYIMLAQSIAEETGATYTHLTPDKELLTYLYSNVLAIPTTLFVDSEGRLVGQEIVGARSREEYEDELKSRLKMLQLLRERAETEAKTGVGVGL